MSFRSRSFRSMTKNEKREVQNNVIYVTHIRDVDVDCIVCNAFLEESYLRSSTLEKVLPALRVFTQLRSVCKQVNMTSRILCLF